MDDLPKYTKIPAEDGGGEDRFRYPAILTCIMVAMPGVMIIVTGACFYNEQCDRNLQGTLISSGSLLVITWLALMFRIRHELELKRWVDGWIFMIPLLAFAICIVMQQIYVYQLKNAEYLTCNENLLEAAEIWSAIYIALLCTPVFVGLLLAIVQIATWIKNQF